MKSGKTVSIGYITCKIVDHVQLEQCTYEFIQWHKETTMIE